MKRGRMTHAMAAVSALGVGLVLFPTVSVAQSETTTGTEIETGLAHSPGANALTFVSGTTTGASGVTTFSGTKQQLGPFTYYNFNRTEPVAPAEPVDPYGTLDLDSWMSEIYGEED